MADSSPNIGVLGASGLIGEAITSALLAEGFSVIAIARRFTAAQKFAFGPNAVECPIVGLDEEQLAEVLSEYAIEIVVNCIGVLQDTSHGNTGPVHRDFVKRLLRVLGSRSAHPLLIQLSIPGDESGDKTSFSRTKREAEREIASGPLPYVILRPGFVVAPAAYGGSALIRALAALPFELPGREAGGAFAVTDVHDITRTIAIIARRWGGGERNWGVAWDIMAREHSTVGKVIAAFRHRFGGSGPRVRLPALLMKIGAKTGDLVSHLGWSPPIRSTALSEMHRGVSGDPEPWITATGIEPAPLDTILGRVPATVQERWFARLYLLKAAVLVSLSLFWIVSGLIPLTVAFDTASAILISHGFSSGIAHSTTLFASIVDIVVGTAIAVRQTCRAGLITGIGTSLFYLAGASVLTPEIWFEPLGTLVKVVPVIVLMLVALVTLDPRG